MPPRRKSPSSRPQGAAVPAAAVAAAERPVPPPVDVPYPGTIKLLVDASDTAQGIFRVHETIPVKAGELILLYPQWLPGKHSPTGPIDKLAELRVAAGGKPLAWTRLKYDVHAFRIDVPNGVKSIDVDFEYLSARGAGEGAVEMTDVMLNVVWDKASLYPAGHYTRGITVAASVKLPPGWQFGSALEKRSQSGGATHFKPVAYNTLVDSPIYAGLHFKRIDLAPDTTPPVHLDMVADAPKYLELTPQQLQAHRELVVQASRLFGSHHYDHYDFLLSLSDQLGGKGLEHKQSSEDGVRADFFSEWAHNAARRDLLAHEYTHSWNGKFRRPADLWTPNFNVPMGDSLLWVYEGQTQYWGYVLTARAGLWSADEYRQALALIAARYERNRPGFAWRPIADTTNDPTIARRAALPYRNWQMSEEYYNAGQLLWLAVDAKLRSLSRGRKSLDDFARAFFGIDDGSRVTRTYVFDDVAAALNRVAKHDWAAWLHARVHAHRPPLEGIAAAGWKLVYTDTQSEFEKQLAHRYHFQPGFMFSLGIAVAKDGRIGDVRRDSAAFKAGVTSGSTLIAVDGLAYRPVVLADAITVAKHRKAPIELLLKYQDRYRSVPVDYHAGLQHPRLERIPDAPDYLTRIIQAK
jgi:predicted metalloprotease with PDZ domain